MTAITGLRGTGQFGTEFRPTNYRELFTLLEPNGTAPLQALRARQGPCGHFEKRAPVTTGRVLWIRLNGAGIQCDARNEHTAAR